MTIQELERELAELVASRLRRKQVKYEVLHYEFREIHSQLSSEKQTELDGILWKLAEELTP